MPFKTDADTPERFFKMPYAEPGMAVGLFGGSFDPPHGGHVLVAEMALKRLGLDRFWWIVTPGNPLKEGADRAPLAERLALSEKIAADPRIDVTAFEASHDLRYTADTLALVREKNPGVDFVWVMGADNLRDFHLWERWRQIAETFPIAVIDRPGASLSATSSVMARAFGQARIDEAEAEGLARKKPPAWTFIHGPHSPLSSTAIRKTTGRAG